MLQSCYSFIQTNHNTLQFSKNPHKIFLKTLIFVRFYFFLPLSLARSLSITCSLALPWLDKFGRLTPYEHEMIISNWNTCMCVVFLVIILFYYCHWLFQNNRSIIVSLCVLAKSWLTLGLDWIAQIL